MREARLRAIALMIAAVAVFSGMDALLKLLSAHYPPMEVTVLRGAASLPFMLLPLLVTGRFEGGGLFRASFLPRQLQVTPPL